MKISRIPFAAALLATAFLGVASGTTARAVVYTDPADAGETLATAQDTTSLGGAATTLSAIDGTFNSGGADADLFKISITSAMPIIVTTNNTLTNANGLDTALFAFDATGAPVVTNDDAAGTVTTSTLTLSAGTYYIGISLSGNEPVNITNALLFAPYPGGDTTAARGPASGLNPVTLSTFGDNPYGSGTGGYEISFLVPEPSTWATLGLGALTTGAVLLRRKTRLA